MFAVLTVLLAGLAAEDQKPLNAFDAALTAALVHFAEEGELDYVRAIVEKAPHLINRSEQFPQPRKPTRVDSFAAIHFAAEHGRDEVVAYLISKGADVNQTVGLDWTPLHIAAAEGHLEIVKMLVKAGAKTNAKTTFVKAYRGIPPSSSDGAKEVDFPEAPSMTPLELARDYKQAEVVKYLESLK